MIILTLLLGGFLLGLFTFRQCPLYDWREPAGALLALICFSALIVAVPMVPLNRMSVHADIQQYRAVQETVERARAAGRDIENAALQLRIAEMNQWRAEALYWRRSAFGLWWPAEVEALEPIR